MGIPYRALIVGGGRMGTGWGGFDAYQFTYCHAKLYREHPRTELMGIVEPNQERRHWGMSRWGTDGFASLEAVVEQPDIVSICTPPEERLAVFSALHQMESIKGVFCEKPYGLDMPGWLFPVQIHYPRRFCRAHQAVRAAMVGLRPTLSVWARKDVTTAVHFTDLANWFNADLIYQDNTGEIPGTNTYRIDAGKWSAEFRNGGLTGGFMEAALDNLIAAIEGREALLSPITDDLVDAERRAAEIVWRARE